MLEFLLVLLAATTPAVIEKATEGPSSDPEIDPLRLLGIGPQLTDLDIAWGKHFGFTPWTVDQISAFQSGKLICPVGHASLFGLTNDAEEERGIHGFVSGGIIHASEASQSADGPIHPWIRCGLCGRKFWLPMQWLDVEYDY